MKSPVKWIGGKRKEIKHFEKYIPEFHTYVEPFFGGGALYWHLKPEHAIINDINPHLINFYRVLTYDRELMIRNLETYPNSKEFYDKIVTKLNNRDFEDEIEQAAIFYYINKTCFSGKWRVNSEGKFNNTYGFYRNENYKNIDEVYTESLKVTEIENRDFLEIFDRVKDDSNVFMFLDPPYLDCDVFYTASQKFEDIYKYILYFMTFCNCKVMLVVKSTDYLEQLFKNHIVDRYRISYRHNAASDKVHEHLVICNYRI